MTDAPPNYDVSFPALDGSNNIINNNNNNISSLNSSSVNSSGASNSWSSSSQNNSPQANQQTKLNYLLLSSNQRAIQQLYQQQQQQQHQQQQQQKLHSQQQQVVDHLEDSDQNTSGAMVAQYHLQPQQPQQQQQTNQTINNNIINSSTNNMQSQPSNQQKRPGLPNPILSSERCIVFKIAPEERRHRDFELEQSKILKEIMQKTNTKIEVTTTKDGALNFCIIGKETFLQAAKNLVLQDFKTSVTLTVSVPKSLHGRLLGPKGQRLASIQDETQTKITIPRKGTDSDIIEIVGLKSNAEKAILSIQKYAREFANKTVEKVSVERIYLLFITGPFNENLKKWEEMGAKVSTSGGILPSSNDRESGHADEVTFTIVGEASAVGQVKEEIQQIYEDKKKKCTTVNMEVKKAQHKYILGPGGQNLRNLFAKTGVSVELPRESEVETITLRGERSKLGPALSELYTQAHSETDEFFEAEAWLHKYLIGPRKTNFIDFKARNVDAKCFDDKIRLHGPPSEVDVILDVLEAELQNLRESIVRKDIRIEPRIHGYIIGKAGATVDQIREESGAYVFVPKNDEPSEFITLEGTREAVAIAEEKIIAIAKKYEASRKLVIDQQLHGSIIGRGGEKIRSIREKFTQVVFTFPEQGSRNNEITILGPTDEVEECYQYLDEFHKQLQESNYQVQVPIKKDIIKYLPDAQQAIKRIKTDHKVKVDLFINTDFKNTDQTKQSAPANASNGTGTVEFATAADSKKKTAKGKAGKKQAQQSNGVSQTSSVANDSVGNNSKSTDGGESYAVVIGKKEDVDQARAKVSKFFEELATTTEFEVKVSRKLYQFLNPKTKLYRQFLDEFEQKVNLTFHTQEKEKQSQTNSNTGQQSGVDAPAATESEINGLANSATSVKKGKKKDDENKIDIVKIRGPKNIAKKAEKKFESLVAECQEKVDKSFAAQVTVDAAVMDKFVYADKIKLNKLRESQNIKLTIPDRREVPQLQCIIVGYEKNVQAAMQQFKRLVKEVEERTEETIEIPSLVHPRLIGAQGRTVKRLMDEFKVNVKFARQGDPNPNSVTLYGSSSAIMAAKNHMMKLADQFMASAGRVNNNTAGASANASAPSNSNNNSQQQPQAASENDNLGKAE